MLRGLLGVAKGSPRAVVAGKEGGSDGSVAITQETYNGSERGRAKFASPQQLADGPGTFTTPVTLQEGEHALGGRWNVTGQYVESAEAGATITLQYLAGEVNLVLATASGDPIDVHVSVDGSAPTNLRVQAADLYNLVTSSHEAHHKVTLTATAPGLRAFAFTFGG